MKKYTIYFLICLIGFFVGKTIYKHEEKQDLTEDIQIITQSIANVSKLVVTEGYFTEMYNYKDAKKYFYDAFEFEKSVIVSVNAKVQVQFDLQEMTYELDSIDKKIIIKSIPNPSLEIFPKIEYFDLKQSSFNTFDKKTLNSIQAKSIEKIKQTAQVSSLKKNAKQRLFEELLNLNRIAVIMGWELVDGTENNFLESMLNTKRID